MTSQRRQRAERRAEDALDRAADQQRRADERQRQVDELLATAKPAAERPASPVRPRRIRPPGPPPVQATPPATRPVPSEGPAAVASRPTPKRLPWEGADADDRYNHGIAAMMREVPGSRR